MRYGKLATCCWIVAMCFWPALSQASFMAACMLEARILKVKNVWGAYGKPYPLKGVPVRLHILRIKQQFGHTDTFCSSQGMVGTGPEVLLRVEKKNAGLIKEGSHIRVSYQYSSGFSRRGAVQFTSWRWVKQIPPLNLPAVDFKASRGKLAAAFHNIETLSKNKTPYIIKIQETDPHKGLRISCPMGVRCDQHFAYHAQSHRNKNIYLYFSFHPSLLVGKVDINALRKHFSYVSFDAKISSLESKGWFTRGSMLRSGALRRDKLGTLVHLDGYRDGRIQGKVNLHLKDVQATFRQAPCAPIPSSGKVAPQCVIKNTRPLWVQIRFDLPMQPRILDCKKIPREKACL